MATDYEQPKQQSDSAPGQLSLPFMLDSEDDITGRVTYPVLDDGFVEIVASLGTDLTVVNAARVSYGKETTDLAQKDKDLLRFLAENRHTSPFRHVTMQFRIRAPEFVARQWYKHVVGADYAFKDTAWNEISQRYVQIEEDFHYPQEWRAANGTGNLQRCGAIYAEAVSVAYDAYRKLLNAGVKREQARIILPLSVYTEWIWTASLQAIAHFTELRRGPHAQQEIREYAEMIHRLTTDYFPESYTALTTYGV